MWPWASHELQLTTCTGPHLWNLQSLILMERDERLSKDLISYLTQLAFWKWHFKMCPIPFASNQSCFPYLIPPSPRLIKERGPATRFVFSSGPLAEVTQCQFLSHGIIGQLILIFLTCLPHWLTASAKSLKFEWLLRDEVWFGDSGEVGIWEGRNEQFYILK